MGAYIINIPDSVDRIIYINVNPMNGKTYTASYGIDNLTPYIEPDLKQVRKEAYEEGRKVGIKDGMCEAWEAARTLWNTAKRKEIFGYTVFSTALMTLTGQEAIEKIRQYEHGKEKIKVGDEVGYYGVADEHGNVCYSGVVLEIREDDYFVMEKTGKTYALKKNLAQGKTGRHFPEIAAVLEKMREES